MTKSQKAPQEVIHPTPGRVVLVMLTDGEWPATVSKVDGDWLVLTVFQDGNAIRKRVPLQTIDPTAVGGVALAAEGRRMKNGYENKSGVTPLEFKCVVLPEGFEVDPALKRARDAGIQIPPDILERELMAQVTAVFVARGGSAFSDWKDERLPQPGERVLIAKYSGVTFRGADGVEYRLLNDKDIGGLVTETGVSRV